MNILRDVIFNEEAIWNSETNAKVTVTTPSTLRRLAAPEIGAKSPIQNTHPRHLKHLRVQSPIPQHKVQNHKGVPLAQHH